MQLYRPTILSFFFLLNTTLLYAQQNWKLATDKNGIKVYTSTVPASKIKAVKVTCDLPAKASTMVALLLDVESATEWIYHTKSCKLIKQISPSELYYYSEVAVPWPVENRDFVAHLSARQHPETRVITIDGPAVAGYVAPKAGVVRISESQGRWQITPLANNHIQVEYTLHVNPGGSLPTWLVNMFATQGPMEIFSKMKIELEMPKYKNAQVAFIRN